MLAIAAGQSLTAWAALPYLNDANTAAPAKSGDAPSIAQHEFPRVYMHELSQKGKITPEMMSRYQFIVAHGSALDMAANAQANWSPETMMLRHYSGRAYQSFAYKPCHVTGGIAFESTGAVSQGGPSSAGCAIYAGHWLYKAGTKLEAGVTASALTLAVEDASRLAAGQYVVIYDAPAGSFKNAEHAKVASRNLSNNTITLQARGFKSKPAAHAAGAVVAQHVLGQGPENELWAFNTSSKSPKDGAGRTFGQFYAEWLKANLMKHRDGEGTTARISGILFDADFYFELATAAPDSNNDLTRDDGMDGKGANWLGEGLDTFYQTLVQKLPNHYIMTGVHEARGFESTQGAEMENWLDYGNGDFRGNPKYLHLNSMISTYFYNMGSRRRGVPLVHNLTKTATRLNPGIANPPPPSNAPVRLGLALTLMDNGYFGTHSRYTPDAWWDEYAVDVTPGSRNYGYAIDQYSVTAIHEHRGWLGRAQGPFKRVYNDADFAVGKSLLANGLFDATVTGWTARSVGVSRLTSGSLDGAGSLRASTMSPYVESLTGAFVRSPNISLSAGKDYTIAFAAKASAARTIKVSLGSESGRYLIGTKWRRYVIPFEQANNASTPLSFYVGRENTIVDFDSIYVLPGNANVFRRDFDRGIALANATSTSRTVQLGGQFLKIKGRQDSAINNGATVSSVTLPPYDGLVLVRRESDGTGGSPPPPPPPPSGGSGDGIIGDRVWSDADGDGIQDGNEAGLGGVTVRLLNCTGTVLDSVVTSGSGAYQFAGLAAGSYQIQFVAPSGRNFSPAYRGSKGGSDSNANSATGMTTCLTMTDGRIRRGIDAGFTGGGSSNANATLGDRVWRDADGDGVQDSNESGLAGVLVELRDCQGKVLDTAVTDIAGAYSFSVAPGRYELRFNAPGGMKLSDAGRGGSPWMDSNPNPNNGLSGCLTVSEKQERKWLDAGMTPL